jgi:catechol-2,3-dioxygenase
MPRLDGSGHVVLLVSSLERSAQWYCGVFGFTVIRWGVESGGYKFASLIHPESHASVGLAELKDGNSVPYSDRQIGLQHYGYHVPEQADLQDWQRHLNDLKLDHSGIVQEGYGSAIRFRDPDNIVIEVFWANRRFFGRLLARALRKNA